MGTTEPKTGAKNFTFQKKPKRFHRNEKWVKVNQVEHTTKVYKNINKLLSTTLEEVRVSDQECSIWNQIDTYYANHTRKEKKNNIMISLKASFNDYHA